MQFDAHGAGAWPQGRSQGRRAGAALAGVVLGVALGMAAREVARALGRRRAERAVAAGATLLVIQASCFLDEVAGAEADGEG